MKFNGIDVTPVLHCYERDKALLVLVAPNITSPCIYIDHAQMNHLCLSGPNRLVSQSFVATAPVPGYIRLVLTGSPDTLQTVTGTRSEFQTLNASITWTNEPLIPTWRFNIDNKMREKHGALLDSEILAEVYLELVGGRQPDFGLATAAQNTAAETAEAGQGWRTRPRPTALPSRLTAEEAAAHTAFVAGLGDAAIWLKRG